jgi:PAS domain S-box-containing protein
VALPLELLPSRTGAHPPSTLLCAIGRDYRFKQLNPAWESLLGVSTQDVRAKSFLDWLHPDDRPGALEEFRRLGGDGEAVSFDARVSSRESRYRRFAWSAFDLHDSQGFYAIGRECPEPESKADEMRIRLSGPPDAILFLNGENRIAVVSSETAAVRRILRAEPVGQGLEVLLPMQRLAPESGRPAPLEVTLGPPRRPETPAATSPVAESRWAAAAEHASDAIVIRSSDDLIRGWNRAAEQLYGYTAAEILGRPITLLLPPECVAEDRRLQSRIFRREPVAAYDTERLRKDGSRIEVSVSVAPMSGGLAATAQFAEIARDVSERKDEERRVARQMEEATRSNAELQEYGSILSHDLQEPLHALVAYLGDFRSRFAGRIDEDGAELLAFALDCAEWMRRLTRDLLDHARLGSSNELPGSTNVEELLDNVLTHLRPQIQHAGARVQRGALPDVVAHKTGLGQVFQNLISNALKFRRKEPPQIRVDAENRPGEVLFRVSDNGEGIAPERLRHLFRPSLRRYEDDPYPGLGMGLAIASRIVERHGGRIWAESTPGRGSTFFFSIPARS